MKHNGGAWFIDFTKPPNYEELSERDREQLDLQVSVMMEKKYEFLHLDGLNKRILDKINKERFLDNKLLIIDEVHNLTNAMTKSAGVRATGLKKLIMEANNLKIVFLSGTPMINNLFEAGQLFNLLRGYIINYQFTLIPSKGAGTTPFDDVIKHLKNHELIDQVIPKKSDNIINLTRVPMGFINSPIGLVNSDKNSLTQVDFISYIQQELFLPAT